MENSRIISKQVFLQLHLIKHQMQILMFIPNVLLKFEDSKFQTSKPSCTVGFGERFIFVYHCQVECHSYEKIWSMLNRMWIYVTIQNSGRKKCFIADFWIAPSVRVLTNLKIANILILWTQFCQHCKIFNYWMMYVDQWNFSWSIWIWNSIKIKWNEN